MNPIKLGLLTALCALAVNAAGAQIAVDCSQCDPVALEKEQTRHLKALEGLRERAKRQKRADIRKKYQDQIKALRAQMEAEAK